MRLIATDLDGTIVRHDGTVSPATAEAFARARDAGVQVVLVTGRPMRFLKQLRPQLGRIGTAICANGAVVYDDDAERVLEASTVPLHALELAHAAVLEAAPDATFAVETLDGLQLLPGFSRGAWDGDTGQGFDAQALHARGVIKLLAKRPEGSGAQFEDAVRPHLGSSVSVTHSVPGAALIEIAAAGVDKAVTLARHADRLGIAPEDVVAFGDMPNDLGMLRWAGLGVAVGRAQPAVAAAADRVIDACEADSVAAAVLQLLQIRDEAEAR